MYFRFHHKQCTNDLKDFAFVMFPYSPISYYALVPTQEKKLCADDILKGETRLAL